MATIHRFPAKKPNYDLYTPPIVEAPSPDDPSQMVRLEISETALEKIIQAGLRNPLFQCWAHLVGVVPPVPNSFSIEIDRPDWKWKSLREASACFKGVRRPYGDEDAGDDVIVYVIDTPYTICWSRPQMRMACVGNIAPVPEGTVLTVQVRPATALQPSDTCVWGTITKWEFVGASTEHPDLPDYFDERYNERLWPR